MKDRHWIIVAWFVVVSISLFAIVDRFDPFEWKKPKLVAVPHRVG
jgi:hypothetical protein